MAVCEVALNIVSTLIVTGISAVFVGVTCAGLQWLLCEVAE